MKLFLKRVSLKDHYTVGRLYVDSKYFCDTLEDTTRDVNKDSINEVKIYGETSIPYGIYPIVFKISPSFHRTMPYLDDIEGFTNIMIHYGNSDKDTTGCILVGKNNIVGRVSESKSTFEELYNIIEGQKNLTIEIE
jgi:hypothetical protein